MSWDDFYVAPDEVYLPRPEDDPAVREIEPELLAMFDENPDQVYYQTQLEIRFERRFFHWVTSRALKALRDSGKIGSSLQELSPGVPLRFYYHHRNRYWKRRASEIRKIVLSFSSQTFANALGHQAEMLVDAGLPRAGFLPMDSNVRTWQGRKWEDTGHDLDRVFSRDGVNYGAEIKNRLGYIDLEELTIKLEMCEELQLKPLFIARMMPKTYIQEVNKAGGFCLLMGRQFYPVVHKEMALLVHRDLGLPVDAPVRLENATLNRFLNWHLKHLAH